MSQKQLGTKTAGRGQVTSLFTKNRVPRTVEKVRAFAVQNMSKTSRITKNARNLHEF